MSFPRYPAYKDSGVKWLGQVPSHWDLNRLGMHFTERREKVSDKDFPPLSVTKNGVVPQLDTAAKTDDGDNRKLVRAGDFVINSRSDRKGSAGLASTDGSVSLINTVVCPDGGITGDFAHHLLRSVSFQEEYYRYGKGIVADLWSTNFSEMRNITVAVPSRSEQTDIAAFLDRETAKIDALVAEQEQLITLLKEKRQAVISHAVTKGLDPSVPMKDSGVEWLGEVPAHWRLGKVKQFFTTTSGSTPNTDRQDVYYNGDIPWIRSLDLTDGDIVEWEIGITPAAIDDTACKLLPVGTVLVAMYGGDGTIGKNGLLRIPAATNQAICALLPSLQVDPEFVLAFMQHQRPYWMVGAEGTRKDPNISQDRVRNAVMPCPPLAEQRVIVEHVRQALSAFDSLEKEAEAVIGILNERRSALISAAVTGQIDVRQLAQ